MERDVTSMERGRDVRGETRDAKGEGRDAMGTGLGGWGARHGGAAEVDAAQVRVAEDGAGQPRELDRRRAEARPHQHLPGPGG